MIASSLRHALWSCGQYWPEHQGPIEYGKCLQEINRECRCVALFLDYTTIGESDTCPVPDKLGFVMHLDALANINGACMLDFVLRIVLSILLCIAMGV